MGAAFATKPRPAAGMRAPTSQPSAGRMRSASAPDVVNAASRSTVTPRTTLRRANSEPSLAVMKPGATTTQSDLTQFASSATKNGIRDVTVVTANDNSRRQSLQSANGSRQRLRESHEKKTAQLESSAGVTIKEIDIRGTFPHKLPGELASQGKNFSVLFSSVDKMLMETLNISVTALLAAIRKSI